MTFPNFIDKYSSKPVFSPEDSEKYRKSFSNPTDRVIPEGVIVYYQRYIGDYLTTNYSITKQKGFFGCDFYLLDNTDQKIGFIGNFGFGAPITVELIEQLIPLDIKHIISIGMAGALQKDMNAGDIIVCDRAIRDEGTSHHYVESSKYSHASAMLTTALQDTLNDKCIDYKTGTSWTTDAPNRETVAEVRQYQNEGVLTVEMEASALFAVAGFRGVEMASILTVSDSLAYLEWKPEFHAEDTLKGLETILTVSIDTLGKII